MINIVFICVWKYFASAMFTSFVSGSGSLLLCIHANRSSCVFILTDGAKCINLFSTAQWIYYVKKKITQLKYKFRYGPDRWKQVTILLTNVNSPIHTCLLLEQLDFWFRENTTIWIYCTLISKCENSRGIYWHPNYILKEAYVFFDVALTKKLLNGFSWTNANVRARRSNLGYPMPNLY